VERIITASRAHAADRDHRNRSAGVRSPRAAACSRARTAASAEDCQKLESVVPDAAPAVRALARIIAVCGSSHPRIGDHRVADGIPGASPCGSNTATGPTFARACSAAVRLSGRVEVVMTAPGASRMALMTMWMPLPERGGPSRTRESSTLA
jgi:hypothetical protein